MSEPGPPVAEPHDIPADVAPLLHSLTAAILAGSRADVVPVLGKVAARQRAALSHALNLWRMEYSQLHPRLQPGMDQAVWDAYRLASAGLAGPPAEAARRLLWMNWWSPVDTRDRATEYVEVFGTRGRAWLTRFAESLLGNRNRGIRFTWHLVDLLVTADLIDPPVHANFRADVLYAYDWQDLPAQAAEDPALDRALRDLFRTPGVGLALGRTIDPLERKRQKLPADASLFPEESWHGLLTAWGRDDPGRRQGLLDDCVTALSGSLPPSDAPGFLQVHKRLDPTIAEVAARQAGYVALLLSPAPGAVALAHAQLERLVAAGELDGAALLAVSGDVLVRREKVVVREHLRLLTAALGAGALDPGAGAEAVVAALDPDRTDLALLMARLLQRCIRLEPELVDPLASAVRNAIPHPSPEMRKALGRLADVGEAPSDPAAARPGPAHLAVPVDVPTPGRLEPVRDHAELAALIYEMHVSLASALDVERALDGLVRLRATEESARAFVKAVFRRPRGVPLLHDVLRAWAGWDTPDARGLVTRGGVADRAFVPPGATVTERRWSVDAVPAAPGRPARPAQERVVWEWEIERPAWTARHLVDYRMAEVRRTHLRRASAPLLSTPTHDDGTVAADAFLGRLGEHTAAGLEPGRHDLGTALLRLRPEDRDEVRAHLGPEPADLLRVLGIPLAWHRSVVPVPVVYDTGRTVSLWQATNPPTGAPDDPVRAWLDTTHLGPMWEHLLRPGGLDPTLVDDVGLWALILPSHPDVLAAHTQRLLTYALEDRYADVSPVMVLLGGYRHPLGPPALHALLVGGSARSTRARAAAAEALAQLSGRGLVHAPVLATALLAALDPDAPPHDYDNAVGPVRPKTNRLVATLTDATRIDDATGLVVLDALIAALAPLSQLHGGVAFVELAARLAERFRVRVELPEPLATLAAGRSSTRTAQEARRLAAAGTASR